jgi:threonine/homoserine/homoserine lactone efflux protein
VSPASSLLDDAFALKGVILGFSIAAPVGPIGLLCIRRSLANGMLAGFLSGLGAATADAAYGAIAGFGFATVSHWLIEQRRILAVVGGAYLCYLGVRSMLEKSERTGASPSAAVTNASAYTSTLLLTLTNPVTILSFVAIFAGLGLTVSTDYGRASQFVVGVFLGSALWWLLLSLTVARLRHTLSPRSLHVINAAAGGVVVAFGLYALTSSLL